MARTRWPLRSLPQSSVFRARGRIAVKAGGLAPLPRGVDAPQLSEAQEHRGSVQPASSIAYPKPNRQNNANPNPTTKQPLPHPHHHPRRGTGWSPPRCGMRGEGGGKSRSPFLKQSKPCLKLQNNQKPTPPHHANSPEIPSGVVQSKQLRVQSTFNQCSIKNPACRKPARPVRPVAAPTPFAGKLVPGPLNPGTVV